jgi:hypothetical protein
MRYAFDEKCYELAQYFMPKASEERVKHLAQVIQDTIENETQPHNHVCQQCDKVLEVDCECENPDRLDWCSSNCREAFDL